MNDNLVVSDRSAFLAKATFQPDRHPALVYLASLSSEGSRRTMSWALNTVAATISRSQFNLHDFPWQNLRFQHLELVKNYLLSLVDNEADEPRYKPESINTILAAVRGTLKQAFALELISAEDYQRTLLVKRVSGETLLQGRALTDGEIQALIQTCLQDDSPSGARDGAVITVLIGTGLRRAELVALDLKDFLREQSKLIVRRGKGRKAREVPITNGPLDALKDWLIVRGEDPGPIFWPINKSGALTKRRLTSQAIYDILSRRADQAKVKNLTPHDCRRTFITKLLDRGNDVLIVSRLAGHASIETTRRYDFRDDASKLAAVESLHIPYIPRQQKGKGK